ncbi:MAG: glycerophosphodiester phosphodiesterase family protein [Clostridia bacterium]
MNIFESWIVRTPIAHRGLHREGVPENSLLAFEEAIQKGYAIELDVRQTKDGVLVVFHDDTLGRMTGKDGYISNSNYTDIKDIVLLKSNEKIPTFTETLKMIDGRTPLLIEIKNMNKVGTMEKDMLKELIKYKGEYAVQSFNPYSLEWFKNNAPYIKRGQLSSFFRGEVMGCLKKYALKRMLLNKKVSEPHFITYNINNLPNKYVKKYASLPLLAYTIRDEEQKVKAKKIADNLIFEKIDNVD